MSAGVTASSAVVDAERIERLAEAYYEVDALDRRLRGLRERLQVCSEECATFELELAEQRRKQRPLRFGVDALWHLVRGDRAELLHAAGLERERLEDRAADKRDQKSALVGESARIEAELAAHAPLTDLRRQLDAAVAAHRAALEQQLPELASQLLAIEQELPAARAELATAERSFACLEQIATLLASANVRLSRAVGRSVPDLLSRAIQWDYTQYASIRMAVGDLRRAARLLVEQPIPELEAVREDFARLEPEGGNLLWLAYVLGSWGHQAVTVRCENSLEGVVEAQKLCADLQPRLERAARHARNHAENLERRWRALLVEATTGSAPPAPA